MKLEWVTKKKNTWFHINYIVAAGNTNCILLRAPARAETNKSESDGKSRNETEERAQAGALGGMSGDKGRPRGIRGSPQSRLPGLWWRQRGVEAEKMKRHLGAAPSPRVQGACERLCLWSPCTLQHPAPPSTSCHLVPSHSGRMDGHCASHRMSEINLGLRQKHYYSSVTNLLITSPD